MTRKKYEKPDLNELTPETGALPDHELDAVTGGVDQDGHCYTGHIVTANCYNGTGANECNMGETACHTLG